MEARSTQSGGTRFVTPSSRPRSTRPTRLTIAPNASATIGQISTEEGGSVSHQRRQLRRSPRGSRPTIAFPFQLVHVAPLLRRRFDRADRERRASALPRGCRVKLAALAGV